MWNSLPYLIEAQICFAVLWIVYRIFLHRDNNFSRNRAYLLSSAPLATLIPLLSIPVLPGKEVIVATTTLTSMSLVPATSSTVETDWIGVLLIGVYLTGVAGMLAILLRNILRTKQLLRNCNDCMQIDQVEVSYIDNKETAFSLGNRIFISRDITERGDLPKILAHEIAHVKLRHSTDLVLAEALRILFWWNPFVYLWIRSLKEVHEFQADEAVLNKGFDSEQYINLILQQSIGIHPEFASGFSYLLIKKRLTMICKKTKQEHGTMENPADSADFGSTARSVLLHRTPHPTYRTDDSRNIRFIGQ